MFSITVAGILYRQKDVVINAYYSGYRNGIRDSAAFLDRHADADILGAPPEALTPALMRASTVHELAGKVRDLAKQIGRAL